MQRYCKGELGEFVFLLNTDERQTSCHVPSGWIKVDFDNSKFERIDDVLLLDKHKSILLKKEKNVISTYMNQKNKVDITSDFSIVDISENNLLLDFAKYSFDGEKYSDSKHTEQILDELILSKYAGKLYLKYEFNIDSLPNKISLLSQNSNVVEVFVNGIKVDLEKTDYDINYYKSFIRNCCKIGKNVIVFCIDFYENPNVHYAIYGENVTESLINMISYDTIIEPIYLQGDFCLDKEFSISKHTIPKQFNNISDFGFPFFSGEIVLESKQNYFGLKDAEIILTGNYMSADIFIDDVLQGKSVLSQRIKLGKTLDKGKIRIVLKSTLRNMYGPHHVKDMHEDWGICPYMFTFYKQWKHELPSDFIKEYNTVQFGLDKIEVIK